MRYEDGTNIYLTKTKTIEARGNDKDQSQPNGCIEKGLESKYFELRLRYDDGRKIGCYPMFCQTDKGISANFGGKCTNTEEHTRIHIMWTCTVNGGK